MTAVADRDSAPFSSTVVISAPADEFDQFVADSERLLSIQEIRA